jgi:hypothetical protein
MDNVSYISSFPIPVNPSGKVEEEKETQQQTSSTSSHISHDASHDLSTPLPTPDELIFP